MDGIRRHGIRTLPLGQETGELAGQSGVSRTGVRPRGSIQRTGLAGRIRRIPSGFSGGLAAAVYRRRRKARPPKANGPEAALENMLTWEQKKDLERLAPSHFTVPKRLPYPGRLQIRGAAGARGPFAGNVRTGAASDSRGGKSKLLLHLLSPAHRPVQITGDLAGFWKKTYHDVKKDLKGRYPKHPWPEDPAMPSPRAARKRPGKQPSQTTERNSEKNRWNKKTITRF